MVPSGIWVRGGIWVPDGIWFRAGSGFRVESGSGWVLGSRQDLILGSIWVMYSKEEWQEASDGVGDGTGWEDKASGSSGLC